MAGEDATHCDFVLKGFFLGGCQSIVVGVDPIGDGSEYQWPREQRTGFLRNSHDDVGKKIVNEENGRGTRENDQLKHVSVEEG